jgi:hypothetical protein
MSATTCKPGLFGLERVRFFERQLLTAHDLNAEQAYLRQRDRRHNRFLHGWGVVCGLSVEPAADATHPWQVRVRPGYAVGPQGDEISVADKVLFDLATGACEQEPCTPWPCPPGTTPTPGTNAPPIYLAIRHLECDSRPVRVHPLGCGCDEMLCEYSRVRDDFELKVLPELPESHTEQLKLDLAWLAELKQWVVNPQRGPVPVPSCAPCPEDPWVVIARITLPPVATTPLVSANISYIGRRALYSTQSLHLLTLATV